MDKAGTMRSEPGGFRIRVIAIAAADALEAA